MFSLICVDLIVMDKQIKYVFQSGSGGGGVNDFCFHKPLRKYHRFWEEEICYIDF